MSEHDDTVDNRAKTYRIRERLFRLCSSFKLGLAALIGVASVTAGPSASVRAGCLFDDFEDGVLLDKDPICWSLNPFTPQEAIVVKDGDLVLKPGAAGWAALGACDLLSGDVSVRTRATTQGAGNIAVAVHVSENRRSSYIGVVWHTGEAQILRVDDLGESVPLSAPSEIEGYSPDSDYIIQMDVTGARLELRVWKPEEDGEPPLRCVAEDESFRSGLVGLLYQVVETEAEGVFRYFDACEVPPRPSFRRGDCNDDGKLDITDVINFLNYQFVSSIGSPDCQDACDTDDNGVLDLTDAVRSLNYQFTGTASPPEPPGPFECGIDPTPEGLTCESFESCQ